MTHLTVRSCSPHTHHMSPTPPPHRAAPDLHAMARTLSHNHRSGAERRGAHLTCHSRSKQYQILFEKRFGDTQQIHPQIVSPPSLSSPSPPNFAPNARFAPGLFPLFFLYVSKSRGFLRVLFVVPLVNPFFLFFRGRLPRGWMTETENRRRIRDRYLLLMLLVAD